MFLHIFNNILCIVSTGLPWKRISHGQQMKNTDPTFPSANTTNHQAKENLLIVFIPASFI